MSNNFLDSALYVKNHPGIFQRILPFEREAVTQSLEIQQNNILLFLTNAPENAFLALPNGYM